MPNYDYQCTNEKCGHVEEDVLMTIHEHESEGKNQTCPKCDSPSEQTITALNFRLVGGMWARDGYAGQLRKEHDEAVREYEHHQTEEAKRYAQTENLGNV